jgi:predicted alpha-1,2-mannosidase
VRRALTCTVALLALAPAARAADVAQHVDPMIGTMAPGFVLPGPVAPFGMIQQSPDTLGPLVYSGYMHHDPAIRGFSLVHLSGPGVDKAGDLPFMPWAGPGAPPSDPLQYAQPYTHVAEQAKAGWYQVLLANGVDVQLTSGLRAGMQRHAFPAGREAYLIVNPRQRNSGATEGAFRKVSDREIAGWTKSRYPVHFVARFDAPIQAVGEHWVQFEAGTTVTMRVGISFVDEDGARRNLAADAPDSLSFDAMRAGTFEAWNDLLDQVRVTGGTPADLRSFYTALYRASLHPNVFNDVDGRYRGFDNEVHVVEDGRTQYANFSSWDTYKSTNQLQALLHPDRYADMLRSLLADAQQGGRLPRWGEQNLDASHMSGDPAIPMIADGACRGLLGATEAQALYEEAVELRSYRDAALDQVGYLPGRPGTTLEYGLADFALALLAESLGHHDEAQRWLTASLSYRRLLDANGWIAPKDADGNVQSGFDPTLADQGFQEGNSWQYTWLVPHDAKGLLDRIDATVAEPTDLTAEQRLDVLFAGPAEAQNRATFFGVYYTFPQWAPGNEHDLGAPWMYAYLGQQWKIAEVLRDANTLYRPLPDGLPGNDDLGGLSAWYAWSALGLVPPTPGAPLHLVGSPIFESVSIALNNGSPRFTIEAPGASPVGMYVQSAALNGKPLERSWFHTDAIRPGGVLRLEMGPTPNKDFGARTPPPSASDTSLEGFGCVL